MVGGPVIISDVKQDPQALKAFNYLLSSLNLKDSGVQLLSATLQVVAGIVYTFELKIKSPFTNN